MPLSEKQAIEKATAEIFLPLYNSKMNAKFGITRISDAPDIECFDKNTGKHLDLEIGLIEDLDGEIRIELRSGKTEIHMPERSFSEDAILNYRKVIENKMLTSYGQNTALVLRQHAAIWGPGEWKIYA